MELPECLSQDKSKLHKNLLDWYAQNRRDFLWRNTNIAFGNRKYWEQELSSLIAARLKAHLDLAQVEAMLEKQR